MKKMLFISNISNRITNFVIPSIEAGQCLGYEFHMAANYAGFSDNAAKYNVTLHHLDLARNPFCVKNIEAYKQLLALLNKEKFDVIHCNTPIGGLLGRLCGKKAKVSKILYTVHGFHFYKGAPLAKKVIFKLAEQWMARYTDVIIAINHEDYQAAQRFKLRRGGKVYYIPGVGVDTSGVKEVIPNKNELLKRINVNDSAILLISVGELNKNKNNRVIIRALGNLKNPNIHYILCGIGSEKDALLKLAEENNIQGNIHFLGYCTDVAKLLKSCDIFVMSSYREGLSRSIMEAMSAGLPCIVSKVRGNVDLIEDGKGGYLFEPDDAEGFAEAINSLVENDTARKTMGRSNQEKVTQFDITNVKLKIRELYENELP